MKNIVMLHPMGEPQSCQSHDATTATVIRIRQFGILYGIPQSTLRFMPVSIAMNSWSSASDVTNMATGGVTLSSFIIHHSSNYCMSEEAATSGASSCWFFMNANRLVKAASGEEVTARIIVHVPHIDLVRGQLGNHPATAHMVHINLHSKHHQSINTQHYVCGVTQSGEIWYTHICQFCKHHLCNTISLTRLPSLGWQMQQSDNLDQRQSTVD